MVLCSVEEVRVEVSPRSLTNADIANIIARTSRSVATQTGGSADASDNDLLNLACIHISAAAVLRKMRVNGELAARVKIGNSEQQNTIDKDIQDHENQAAIYMKKYRYSPGYRVPYGRSGPRTVNKTD
ncbi:hypothetical protein [Methanosarcina acetivorans]|nr:hypothetical protein [Methanosarcina acetivorans]